MRLLEAASFFPTGPPRFAEFFESRIPEYIILSHRWGDQEVSYQDVADEKAFWLNRVYNKEGYAKIQHTARRALEYNIEWIWCDTCCIDKKSSAELTESINSMYEWYRKSKYCFTYLNDWPDPRLAAFTESVWFTRCWTLQELIAPSKLAFFDKSWAFMDYKVNLADQISARTGIDKRVFLGAMPLDHFSIAQRMSWSAGRVATKTEDEAYCLLGIFDVNMPMLYGEGKKAFVRLQEEIMRRDADQSILAWSTSQPSRNLFASSPKDFINSGDVRQIMTSKKPFMLNNLGLEIELVMRQIRCNTYAAYLACETERRGDHRPVCLTLEYDPITMCLWRINGGPSVEDEKYNRQVRRLRKFTILRSVPDHPHLPNALYGFRLGDQFKSFVSVNDWDTKHYWDAGRWERDATTFPWASPVFKIPDGEAPSIATLILFLGRERLLVHLVYDFDFKPCCYISKHRSSSGELFYARAAWDDDSENFLEDLDSDAGWTKSIRYQEIENKLVHPYTGQKAWAAKSIDGREFAARIPTSITKPHTNIEVSFTTAPQTGDWVFGVRQTRQTREPLFWDLDAPIVSAGDELQEILTRYYDLATPSP